MNGRVSAFMLPYLGSALRYLRSQNPSPGEDVGSFGAAFALGATCMAAYLGKKKDTKALAVAMIEHLHSEALREEREARRLERRRR
jgi:formiminotetrahydrofolate cyclodeaminase